MAKFELIMPKLGESIMEATILKWTKAVGDTIEMDETVLEIATDKVDSEVPSPVDGVLKEILFKENDVVAIGAAIAIIETEGASEDTPAPAAETTTPQESTPKPVVESAPQAKPATATSAPQAAVAISSNGNRFYSPLVKNIARQENISQAELDAVPGTGHNGRVTKKDILNYIKNRPAGGAVVAAPVATPSSNGVHAATPAAKAPAVSVGGGDEIVQMDRMRKLIAEHMVMSKRVSPHVTSFVEADVTNLVNWRNKIKKNFVAQHGEKITYTPIFMEAVAKALQDFPMVNVAVDGDKIIVRKNINIGMAAALPSGNLIVPVIRDANHLNLVGLAKKVNDLAGRARQNKLKPDEIQGGTFTLTNVGTFGNLSGTPIINQPQVAILSTGAIIKKPAVLETEHGDVIAIRQMMFLSLSYDHRVVDGFLGGSFLRKVADYLEAFDPERIV